MNQKSIFSKVSLLMAFVLVSTITHAQEYFIGQVINQDKEPLVGATVGIESANSYTVTDHGGYFKLDADDMSNTVTVTYVGYQAVVTDMEAGIASIIVLDNQENLLNQVLVSSVRVKSDAPVTHSNLDKQDISTRNLGQDIPILMNYMPSVVTTSDAGAGVGYTGIRVRGSDATRVNVTINGIPYNDSESMGTFWVNMPDFASSTQNIQLQRGLGTSTNGAGAFGASLNILTDNDAEKPYGEFSASRGSFNTQKYTLKLGTGKINDNISLSGRLSKITSDGYIDRASSDLNSYFLQGSYSARNTLVKALVFGGHEKTYQSWNGIDSTTMSKNRTFNSAGAIWGADGVTGYYDNEVDNYKQDHYQLHWSQQYDSNLSSTVALHYTYGRGYYEQYKQGAKFSSYGLKPVVIGGDTIRNTDLVRRKWLDNDFYGLTANINYKQDNWDIVVGGAANEYDGDHFGRVIWARYASDSEIRHQYYKDNGKKTDISIFAKANYQINDQWALYVDLQNRNLRYRADGVQSQPVDDTFNFINPKAGVSYKMDDKSNFYLSYARGHREPNRTDYENGNPKPEKMDDIEMGWRYLTQGLRLNSNVYYMFYNDQLALTGEIDEVGSPIRSNIGQSYRMGLELDALIDITDRISVRPNITVSQNKNIDMKQTVDKVVKNLGNTDISYSPNIIAGNIVNFNVVKGMNISLLSKYVGKQYMSNTEFPASQLDAYFVNDLNITYSFRPSSTFREVALTGLVNNIFNEKYSSNGYMWGTTPYYYPQAGTNFLVGLTCKF